MPFKEVEQVIYRKNPLIQVVCQLRFPRILSINEKLPADFQEAIRKEYPLFEVNTEQQQQVEFNPALGDTIPVPRIVQIDKTNNYQFTSADGVWRVNLTSTFLALSTSLYVSWKDFRSRLELPLKALIDIYQPAFFERIGIRYIDAFQRSKLGLESTPWNELIQPFALGLLSDVDVMNDIRGFSSVTEINIGEDAIARINASLGFVGDNRLLASGNQLELSFIVDTDLFCGKRKIEETDTSLTLLHSVSYKLIRALITDKLHDAMEPEKK